MYVPYALDKHKPTHGLWGVHVPTYVAVYVSWLQTINNVIFLPLSH